MRRSKADIRLDGASATVRMKLDGYGEVDLATGSAFLDHMLHAFARTGGLDLKVKASGSSYQRSVAVGRVLGAALDKALGDKSGIRRYGWAAVPMDESLAEVALDISGREYLIMKGEFSGERIGDFDTQQIRAVIESMVNAAQLTLNIRFEGKNDHHKAESLFKALGLALKDAVKVEGVGIPSTKGVI